jgi:Ubiquitin-activating enzyme E1 FCCH domain
LATPVIKTSFASGELSPTLFGRVDLDKYASGARLMRNFFVDYRGGASNRAGTKYCGKAFTLGARLMPFEFSISQTYMLEFGNFYIRFYSNGGQVLENPTTITGATQANPCVIHDVAHGYTTGDEVVITNVVGMTRLNNRNFYINVIDADHYSLTNLFGVNINSIAYSAYVSGGQAQRVYTLTSPYAIADVFALNFDQSADVITIVHPSYAPMNLSRVSSVSFTLTAVVVGPVVAPPSGLSGTASAVSSSSKNKYGYCITAVSQDGKEESLQSNLIEVDSDILDQNSNKVITLSWTASSSVTSVYNVYKWGPVQRSDAPATVFGYIGQTKTTRFIDNNIGADFSKTPPSFQDPFSPGQIEAILVATAGAGATTDYVPLTITGDGTGATGYAICDRVAGTIVGAVVTNGGKGYTHATITPASGTATFTATIGPASGTYPSVVSYSQQRRAYAAPNNSPEAMTLSQIGNYNNFDNSPILADNESITLTLASGKVDYIRSMTSLATGLITLTAGGAFLISGGSPGTAITPSNIVGNRQASHGSNTLPALVINYDVLYQQYKGNTVRDLSFSFYLQSYVGQDRSAYATHLFVNFSFIQWCWAQEPLKIVWMVRSDGTLLSLTYVPEQEVYGWAHHDTQGFFKSVATISEGSLDAVYVIARRYIQNQWVDYIERLDNRTFDCVFDCWFLDAAVATPLGSPVNQQLFLSAASGNITVIS